MVPRYLFGRFQPLFFAAVPGAEAGPSSFPPPSFLVALSPSSPLSLGGSLDVVDQSNLRGASRPAAGWILPPSLRQMQAAEPTRGEQRAFEGDIFSFRRVPIIFHSRVTHFPEMAISFPYTYKGPDSDNRACCLLPRVAFRWRGIYAYAHSCKKPCGGTLNYSTAAGAYLCRGGS